jgi:hypothetical protein
VVHLEVDSLAASMMAFATPSVESTQLLVSDALFAKELCDLLVSLEAASPGSAKKIACLLSRRRLREKKSRRWRNILGAKARRIVPQGTHLQQLLDGWFSSSSCGLGGVSSMIWWSMCEFVVVAGWLSSLVCLGSRGVACFRGLVHLWICCNGFRRFSVN